MSDEIIESAKAVQEIAKTTGQAISTVDKIGSFFSKIMKESMDATCGMLADTLKFKRWERQISLIDKAERIIRTKKLTNKMRSISPKMALPIFKYASLEEDDLLHDIWANLLVTALDPSCQLPRSAFIDIIRQLEPVDVKILNYLYKNFLKQFEQKSEIREKSIDNMVDRTLREWYGDNYNKKRLEKDETDRIEKFVNSMRKTHKANNPPTEFPILQTKIMSQMNIDYDTYWASIDNLIRERLASSYTGEALIPIKTDDELEEKSAAITYDFEYNQVCITTLGVFFVRACTAVD